MRLDVDPILWEAYKSTDENATRMHEACQIAVSEGKPKQETEKMWQAVLMEYGARDRIAAVILHHAVRLPD